MNDLISRQAAIRWVKTECNPYGKPTLDFESGKKVIKHLEQMPSAHPDQKWIPVTERLPEENGTYLACYEDATVLLDWFNGKWFFYRTNPAVEETGTIIAWRPIPEPYTEEEA